MARFIGPASALFLFALAACSTVRFEDGEASAGRDDPEGDDGFVSPDDDPLPTPDDEPTGCDPKRQHAIGEITSGTLFGDVLHVRGVVDWNTNHAGHAYAVLALGPDDAYATVTTLHGPAASGTASWAPLGEDRFARYELGTLTTIDATDPKAPVVLGDVQVGGAPTASFPAVMGFRGDTLHVCTRSDTSSDAASGTIDLSRLDAPSPIVWDAISRCGAPALRGTTRDGLWITSGRVTQGTSDDSVAVFDVLRGESRSNHGWNTVGVHAYGDSREVATDGEIVVTTLANPAYVFIFFRDPAVTISPLYSSFGSTEKKLLDVVDGVAYVALAAGADIVIEAFDVLGSGLVPEGRIPPTAMHVALTGAAGSWQDVVSIGRDARRLVVTDANGVPFVVPLGGTSPVRSLPVYDEGACGAPSQ